MAQQIAVDVENMASVNVTYGGATGDLADPVRFDASEEEVLAMVQEALRAGSVIGISAAPDADLSGYKAKPIKAAPEVGRHTNVIVVRPGTGFGGGYDKLPNLMPKTANVYGKGSWGCKSTQTEVMLSLGGLVPYGGDNRPSGEVDPGRILDVFLSRELAEELLAGLGRVLEDNKED